MKTTHSLGQTVCLKYCSYYKPGKNEELACRCSLVVEQIMHSGKPRVPGTFKKEHDHSAAETIIQKICRECDFYERDCDFMQDPAAPPCGGMVVLTQLLRLKKISVDDLVTTNKKVGKK